MCHPIPNIKGKKCPTPETQDSPWHLTPTFQKSPNRRNSTLQAFLIQTQDRFCWTKMWMDACILMWTIISKIGSGSFGIGSSLNRSLWFRIGSDVVPCLQVSVLHERESNYTKLTLDTVIFKSTPDTVKYLTWTLDTDHPFKGPTDDWVTITASKGN